MMSHDEPTLNNLISSPPTDVPPLNQFYLYLSSGCNLKCRHCWITPTYNDGKTPTGETLDVQLLVQAVREAKPLGLTAAKLTGGEPMLHPQFRDIVDTLSAENLHLYMETNGTLMTQTLAAHLKTNTSMNFISISLDGATENSHDRFRGVSGAYQSALQGVEYLVEAGYTNVQIIMSVYRGNIHEVPALVKIAEQRGVRSIKFNPVTSTGRGTIMHKHDETLDFDEMIAFIRYVRGELQSQTSLSLSILTPPAISTIDELLQAGNSGTTCGVQGILGILATGEMALCGIGRTIPELIYGRLGQDNIQEIWLAHPVILELREQLKNYRDYPGICSKCIHAKTCLTHCIAQNYVDRGRLVWPSPLCAEMEARDIFPASRLREFSYSS